MERNVLMIILLAAAFTVLLSSDLSAAQINKEKPDAVTWTGDCDAKCEGGKCNTIIGRTEWADEGDGCKHVKEIKDLSKTGKFNVVTESDGVHGLEVVKFNYSCVVLRPYSADILKFEYNKNVPLKSGDETMGYVKIPGVLSPVSEITVCPQNGALTNYSYGEHSTTVQLDDPDIDIMDDVRVRSDNPDANYGGATTMYTSFDADQANINWIMVKANLTELPAFSVVTDSVFSMYVYSNGLDSSDEGYNLSANHIYNFPYYNITGSEWTEETATWNNKPSLPGIEYNSTKDDDYYLFGGAGEPSGRLNWNVTNMVSKAVSDGSNNVSIYMIGHDYFGTPDSDYVIFYSKEYGTAWVRPYLNITYTEGAAADVSFLVQYPDQNYTTSDAAGNHSVIVFEFNSTTGNEKNVSACIAGNSGYCQTVSLGMFTLNNTGDTSIKWESQLSGALPPSILTWATLTSSHSSGIIPVNDTDWALINGSIGVSESDAAWFWANFTAASDADNSTINVTHRSTDV